MSFRLNAVSLEMSVWSSNVKLRLGNIYAPGILDFLEPDYLLLSDKCFPGIQITIYDKALHLLGITTVCL